MKPVVGVLLALAALGPAAASAQVFRWEEPDGTVHFSNAPDDTSDAERPDGAVPIPANTPPAVTPMPAEGPAAAAAPRPETVTAARALTRIAYSPGAPIIVSARIGEAGAPVSLILDTGADRTVVTPQALSRLGISTANAHPALILGVTGAGQADVVQVSSVQVGEARVGPLGIIAHDAELPQAEGLLGRDFLEQFTVTIDARDQIVILSPK